MPFSTSSRWPLLASLGAASLLAALVAGPGIAAAAGRTGIEGTAPGAPGRPIVVATRMSSPTPAATPTPTATPTITPTPTPAYLPRVPKEDGQPADLIVHGNESSGCAALTFDVAISDNAFTADILDTLARARVRSTFFVTGEWVESNPELAARIADEGHEIANHSYDHPHFNDLTAEQMLWQVERTDEMVRAATGRDPAPYFRPPFGEYDGRVLRVLGGAGYYVIYWTLDSTDWQPSSTVGSVISRVVNRTGAGDIVVLHGYVPKTASALPSIIEQLTEQGICLDTLSTILR